MATYRNTALVTRIPFNLNCAKQSKDPGKQELCVGRSPALSAREDRDQEHDTILQVWPVATLTPTLLSQCTGQCATLQPTPGLGVGPSALGTLPVGKATGKEDEGFSFR